MDIKRLKIPDEKEWHGYQDDLDVKYMHDIFFGKSWEQVQGYFSGGRSIDRADELLFCPRLVFQYYIQAFVNHLRSAEAKGDSDSASPFLRLLKNREEKDPGSVSNIFAYLEPIIDFVASNQEYFEAPIEIYGNFKELANEVRKVCKA